jgi:hypothetical protein
MTVEATLRRAEAKIEKPTFLCVLCLMLFSGPAVPQCIMSICLNLTAQPDLTSRVPSL